jgi:hypothetical protein
MKMSHFGKFTMDFWKIYLKNKIFGQIYPLWKYLYGNRYFGKRFQWIYVTMIRGEGSQVKIDQTSTVVMVKGLE